MKTGTRNERRFWCVVAALVGFAVPGIALACGGFFVPESEVDTAVVDTNDQRVLYAIDGGTIRQFVQVEYSGQATQLAWVYPVAGNPTVAAASSDLFERADEISRPSFTITTPARDESGGSSGGGGCGIRSGEMSDWAGEDGGVNEQQVVTVWSSGQVGMFDYVVVSSATVEPLMTWLGDNGFAVPAEATPVVEHYVGAGWFFVAMRISADQAETAQTSTATIVFEYQAAEATFPLHMASMSSADGVSILLYVIADRSYDTEGLSTTTIDFSRLAATSSSTTNYDSLFLEAVGSGAQRSFVGESVVSAEPLLADALPGASGSFVLTRLRTRLDTAQMGADVRLVPSPVERQPLAPRYEVTWEEGLASAATNRDGLIAFAGIGLVCFFTFRRLRRRG